MDIPADPLDPRPVLDEHGRVRGVSCRDCAHVSVHPRHRCPVCGGGLEPAAFSPAGVVWASTVVRIPVPGHQAPFGLAYIDLDAGPRLLAHVGDTDAPLGVGTRVAVIGSTEQGDLEVAPT